MLEPLLAPRLDAAGRLAPPDSELSDEDVLLALFDDVTVIVVALCELELDDPLLEDDEPDEEPPPPPPPNTLAAADMEPRDDPRLPLILLRLPRNCGAMTAAKRSATSRAAAAFCSAANWP